MKHYFKLLGWFLVFHISFIFHVAYGTEGLLPGTLIKTGNGYKDIATLQSFEEILGCDAEGQSCDQLLLAHTECTIQRYIKISCAQESFCTAPHQQLYLPYAQLWKKASELSLSDVLAENFVVDKLETIDQQATAYVVSVEHHYFYITEHDIVAHNMNAALVPAARYLIGSLKAVNPVVALLGTTMVFKKIQKVARDYIWDQEKDDWTEIPCAAPFVPSSESTYYLKRKQELESLKNEFSKILKDLELNGILKNPLYFTSQFLTQITQSNSAVVCPVANVDESKLTPAEYHTLQELRQAQLTALETAIVKIQVLITFHLNELIHRKNNAQKETEDLFSTCFNAAQIVRSSPKNTALAQKAKNAYTLLLTLEESTNNLEAKLKELSIALSYYANPAKASLVKSTTTLMTVLAHEQTDLSRLAKAIQSYRTYTQGTKHILEKYFADQRIGTQDLKNKVIQETKAKRQTHYNQEIAESQKRKAAIQFLQNESNDNNDSPPTQNLPIAASGSPGPPDPNDPWGNKNKENSQKEWEEKLRKAIAHATTDNQLNHFFGKPKHGLDVLLDKISNKPNKIHQKQLVEEVLREVMKDKVLPQDGTLSIWLVNVRGEEVTVKFFMGDGIVKIGTMFIKGYKAL